MPRPAASATGRPVEALHVLAAIGPASGAARPLMAALPLELEEKTWLIERSAELVAAAGWQRLVQAPLVLPDQCSFPDPWTPDLRGLRRLALRLLAYAGLDHLDVAIEVFRGERKVKLDGRGVEREVGHEGAAAWFAGIFDGVCMFGCDVGQLDDPAGVVGAMAHEVAHAFRRFHALEVEDRELEERLTDLTCIYLGFGVLSTNAALRHRSFTTDNGMFQSAWSRNQLGYLPAAAMSFLLGQWWYVRGDDAAGRRAIVRALEPNQAAWFKATLRWLGKQATDHAVVLGLPPRERWPRAVTVESVAVDYREHEGEYEYEYEDHEPEQPKGAVFRVRKRRPWEQSPGRLVGAGVGVLASCATASPGLAAVGTAVTLALLNWSARWYDRCSDPACMHALDPQDRACPGCRRPIAWDIADPADRLAAEDRLLGEDQSN